VSEQQHSAEQFSLLHMVWHKKLPTTKTQLTGVRQRCSQTGVNMAHSQ